jgi:phosphonate degradation associated HDIG domain protein
VTDRNRGEKSPIEQIAGIFHGLAATAYVGEAVTVAEHMLQTASAAQAEGASDDLIAAALLHDIGHLADDRAAYSPDETVDWRHEVTGAAMLEAFFPPIVAQAVRLHVAAKRYLCAIEPEYIDTLSRASKYSLSLQGGPMSKAEAATFRDLQFSREAVRVRRWDDGGKVAGAPTRSFDDFRPLLLRVIRQDR